jgi:hypothetical protein
MEGMDWARQRFRWILWVVVAAVTVISLVMLARYYPLPKQGFQQALTYVAAHRGSTDHRIGLTLGGKAARFYDPTWEVIEDSSQLQRWLKTADRPTWVLYTFENELRRASPELYYWLMTSTTYQARFPSVIGDGVVYVRLWLPSGRQGSSAFVTPPRSLCQFPRATLMHIEKPAVIVSYVCFANRSNWLR